MFTYRWWYFCGWSELLESGRLELGLPERIFQVVEESVKAVLFDIDWRDFPPRKLVEMRLSGSL